MIRFPCHCGHLFNLTEDQAGALIQCPRCGRLNDVPTLSDLEHLESDGIFKIDNQITQSDPSRIPQAHRAFTRSHHDQHGEEIDLRPSVEDVLRAGTVETFELADEAESDRPKYDPLTGELIRPLDVKHDQERPAEVPLAQAAITYAAGEQRQQTTASAVLLELLAPLNAVVMLFIFIFHFMASLWNLFVMIPARLLGLNEMWLNPLVYIIIAHYANVIDETGPEQKDEIPRPLRNLSWTEDFWWPLRNFGGAVLACYFPLMILWVNRDQIPIADALAVMLIIGGNFFFPAVLLTTTTSGSSLNLRPDRIVGVVAAIGLPYFGLVLLWTVLWPTYLWTFGGESMLPHTALQALFSSEAVARAPVLLTILMLNIFLAHFFCWYMGLMYRRHHLGFPWVLQRHISTRKDTLAQLEQRRKQRQLARPQNRP